MSRRWVWLAKGRATRRGGDARRGNVGRGGDWNIRVRGGGARRGAEGKGRAADGQLAGRTNRGRVRKGVEGPRETRGDEEETNGAAGGRRDERALGASVRGDAGLVTFIHQREILQPFVRKPGSGRHRTSTTLLRRSSVASAREIRHVSRKASALRASGRRRPGAGRGSHTRARRACRLTGTSAGACFRSGRMTDSRARLAGM